MSPEFCMNDSSLGKDFWCHCFGLKIFQDFKRKPNMCSKAGFLPNTWSPVQGRDAHASPLGPAQSAWKKVARPYRVQWSANAESSLIECVLIKRCLTCMGDALLFWPSWQLGVKLWVNAFLTPITGTLWEAQPLIRAAAGGKGCWWNPGKMTWSPAALSLPSN